MKSKTIKKIFIFGFVCSLVGSLLLLFGGGSKVLLGTELTIENLNLLLNEEENISSGEYINETFKSTYDVNTLYIEADVCDINLHYSEQFSIRSKNFIEGQVVFSNGLDASLVIDQSDEFNNFSNVSDYEGVVDIYVPSSVKSVVININVGNIEFDELSIDSLEIYSDIGNIEVEGLYTTLLIHASLGNIEFNGDFNTSLTIECDAGNTDIELTNNELDYNYDLTSNLGNIEVFDNEISGLNTSYVVNNNATKTITIHSEIGAICIENE